jgi:hypothetical protein
MPQLKLTGGFYEAKNLIANAQRCVNLYPEKNQEDAPFPFTHYLTPGLRRLSSVGTGAGQGLYTTTQGALYAAMAGNLYFVSPSFQFTQIAQVNPTGRVYMKDNASAGQMLVVDGSNRGLSVNLSNRVATVITDPAFYGGTRVDFVDGYFVLNVPGQNEGYLSNQYAITFNPLYFAGKTGGGDPVVAIVALHREQWWFGTETTEVWYNTGATAFPYAPIPGVFIQHGVAAVNSITTQDLSIYWLSQNPLGQGIVLRGNGYQAKRISTHAIENAIQSYSVISDAIGFMYQQDGHVFYVLVFPTANATWVFDEATQLWHERVSVDENGNEIAVPVGAATMAYGQIILQDRNDGSLYTYDLDYGQDDVATGVGVLKRLRTFPHLINDGKRLEYSRFIADLKTGSASGIVSDIGDFGDTIDGQPMLAMRFSDDRGCTWSTYSQQTFGATGRDSVQIIWPRLGVSKDRIFELSWSTQNLTALNGAFIEVRPAAS